MQRKKELDTKFIGSIKDKMTSGKTIQNIENIQKTSENISQINRVDRVMTKGRYDDSVGTNYLPF
jgi:hypothetical protein